MFFEYKFFRKNYFLNSIEYLIKNYNKLKVGIVIKIVFVRRYFRFRIFLLYNINIVLWKML